VISKREEEQERQAPLYEPGWTFVREAYPEERKAKGQASLWHFNPLGAGAVTHPSGHHWLLPHEVVTLGLAGLMREAMQGCTCGLAPYSDPACEVHKREPKERAGSPDVRPAGASEGTVVSADDPGAFEEGQDTGTDTEEPPRAAPVDGEGTLLGVDPNAHADQSWASAVLAAVGPQEGAPVEATTGGGHTASGWRWWIMDDTTVAYDNRPQIEAEAKDLEPTSRLVQGVVPLSLLEFVRKAVTGGLDDEQAVRLAQQRADVAQVWSLIDSIWRQDDDPWGTGYRQALTDLRAELLARFGKPEAQAEPGGDRG
jgi:hypothetical protein